MHRNDCYQTLQGFEVFPLDYLDADSETEAISDIQPVQNVTPLLASFVLLPKAALFLTTYYFLCLRKR